MVILIPNWLILIRHFAMEFVPTGYKTHNVKFKFVIGHPISRLSRSNSSCIVWLLWFICIFLWKLKQFISKAITSIIIVYKTINWSQTIHFDIAIHKTIIDQKSDWLIHAIDLCWETHYNIKLMIYKIQKLFNRR